MTPGGSVVSFGLRWAGASCSLGATITNSTADTRQTTAGTR